MLRIHRPSGLTCSPPAARGVEHRAPLRPRPPRDTSGILHRIVVVAARIVWKLWIVRRQILEMGAK